MSRAGLVRLRRYLVRGFGSEYITFYYSRKTIHIQSQVSIDDSSSIPRTRHYTHQESRITTAYGSRPMIRQTSAVCFASCQHFIDTRNTIPLHGSLL